MKTINRISIRFFATVLMIIALACSNDDSGTDQTEPPITTIAEIIASGDEFESYPEVRTTNESNVEPPYNEDYERNDDDETSTERFICTKRRVSIEDGSKDFFLFNPNSGVIYPGNLLQGKTLDDATPESIPLKRGPGVISYNIIDGNLSSSVAVGEISLSAVRDAQNEIIAGSIVDGDPSMPAKFNLSVEEVQSTEELALKLGLKFKTFAAKISGELSVNTSSEVNNVIIKLTQEYYTMDVDVPTSPEAFFDESVTPERLAEYVQNDNPATYISSVTYGRIFYMLFESTSSESEMKSKLNAGYKTIGASTQGTVEFDSFKSLKNLSLKVIAYGGKSAETLEAVGNFADNESIGMFLGKIGESSDITTGLPLSYVLNSVERPSKIVGAKLATEFDITTCELKGILPPAGYRSLIDLFKDDEDGGGIGAMVQVSKSNVLIFNKLGSKYAWYNGATAGQIKGIFNITDADSPLGVVPLDNVGTATQLSDNRIYFFDQTGLVAVRFKYFKNNANNGTNGDAPTVPIGAFPDTKEDPYVVNTGFGDSDNFPFVNIGFEAGVRAGEKIVAFFGKPGNEYAIYNTDDGSWNETKLNSIWWDNKTPDLFEKVGGATYIEFSDSTGRWLFVNADGSEIMEYQSTPVRKFEGPWVIN